MAMDRRRFLEAAAALSAAAALPARWAAAAAPAAPRKAVLISMLPDWKRWPAPLPPAGEVSP